MAKQTQPKDQTSVTATVPEKVVNDTPNTPELHKDAFGGDLAQSTTTESETPVNEDNHNPYSQQNISENEAVKISEIIEPIKTESLEPLGTDVIQPTIQNEPIKPTLTDQVVYEDFSKDSTVKVENNNGVVVNLSGTAAKILKGLDATTKIVK
ncbi:hypothetical protein NAL32_07520 [Chryseobacterium sp. Ch-15]|uniref:Uncharacterized protein n=1 Tax=Chryseobacterium muglaense TaxID=2893752 RepID=A0A9Q3UQD6_9FLAO|nr:hypothetical protein [Chryseobacterium muglaense]MBD3904479.1 hypothetical protein [Chryseobacterium muglaense]MCC9032702.1 hypothetical protein [Chryseobacterium muglaense]MCM2554241.1 hypothetical protein [Chryseobacterium muglaense]